MSDDGQANADDRRQRGLAHARGIVTKANSSMSVEVAVEGRVVELAKSKT